MNFPTISLFVWLWWSVSCGTAQAVDVQGHVAAENDRFANDPSFIGNGYDWSGIGRAYTGEAGKGGHWVTLISENVFLSASHYHPAAGTDVYFYPDNDSAGSPLVRTITGGQRVGSSDLWIGHFDEAVPDTVSYFNRITEPLTPVSYPLSMLADENALVTGITSTGTGYGLERTTNLAVGRNTIEDYVPSVTVNDTTAPALMTVYDEYGGDNHVPYESQLRSGDSGGPLFIDHGGNLLLAGINWAIGEVDVNPGIQEDLREIALYSYVGNYNADIRNYMNIHPATSVPEPSAMLMLVVSVCLMSRRQR